ncbi:MAG: GTPase Era [Clostridiales bacterium]|nr:GTPase Era [Clostridiales bacterium]
MEKFRSGFVSIIGKPNVGKSTLMNLLAGEKISIVSSKPQTTRNRIRSILTRDGFQAVFIDTPGIHKPSSKLGSYMVKSAENSMNEVDCILYLVEPRLKKLAGKDESGNPSYDFFEGDKIILERLRAVKPPVILVINKIDTVSQNELLQVIDRFRPHNFAEVMMISALKAKNTDELLEIVMKMLPLGPKYFPDGMVTDQPERQIASELIREKALIRLKEEVPHGVAVEILSMKNVEGKKDLIEVQANIVCEKDSHKGIIIGKGGLMLKEIGTQARRDIEMLLGSQVNLQLWVKVKKGWKDDDFQLKSYGYDIKSI